MADPLNILHTVGFDVLYPIVRGEIKFNQPLDAKKLEKAVVSVTQVVPELMATYDIDKNEFQKLAAPAVSVIHYVQRIDDQATAELDFETQPQWQIYWSLSENKLVVYGSHILTDGAGFKQLLYLLADCYTKERPAEIQNHTEIDGIKKLLKQTKPTQLNNDHPRTPLSLPQLCNSVNQPRHYQVVHTELDLRQSHHLHYQCRRLGIHLNDAFMAAYGKAIQQYCGVETIGLACPTDMRKFLPADEQKQLRVQNMTGRYNVQIEAPLSESIADTAWHVHRAMNEQKERYAFLESFRSMLANLANGDSIAKLQQDVQKHYHVRGISYTNLAIIDAEKLNFGDAVPVSCLISGGFREMPKYQIAVSTFRKRINLVANVIGTPQEIWLARAVMNQMKLFLLVI
ncbi:hypothetical protein [Limosilactobacillus mucosae]|uniref:hypothetical protein n=1 Tax=Limosilactobacillus mucosae TaxID=97478 RepID=UPI00233E9B73|nr:hypothetical protein [Limosilactobacillus mucosae]MDC2840605.1 hypothetical protein [Limosilactobacillus mucosae]